MASAGCRKRAGLPGDGDRAADRDHAAEHLEDAWQRPIPPARRAPTTSPRAELEIDRRDARATRRRRAAIATGPVFSNRGGRSLARSPTMARVTVAISTAGVGQLPLTWPSRSTVIVLVTAKTSSRRCETKTTAAPPSTIARNRSEAGRQPPARTATRSARRERRCCRRRRAPARSRPAGAGEGQLGDAPDRSIATPRLSSTLAHGAAPSAAIDEARGRVGSAVAAMFSSTVRSGKSISS